MPKLLTIPLLTCRSAKRDAITMENPSAEMNVKNAVGKIYANVNDHQMSGFHFLNINRSSSSINFTAVVTVGIKYESVASRCV